LFRYPFSRLDDSLGLDPFTVSEISGLRSAISSTFMSMLQNSPASLWEAVSTAVDACDPFVSSAETSLLLSDLLAGSVLGGRSQELSGASVLIATTDQLTAAAALIELDGVARRMVLCPPDVLEEYLPSIVESAEVDAIVSDRIINDPGTARVSSFIHCDGKIVPKGYGSPGRYETEWVLLTSGTTGVPKLVVHTLASLAGAIGCEPRNGPVIWSTFYDIRRYGGLQILLRAILTGSSLLLSDPQRSTADFLARVGAHGVTHISGTPSHWRRALMSSSARLIAPEYIRLSGEIADQGILNHLAQVYPQARIAHAFATSEAGVAFDVNDGMTGFPSSVLERTQGVEMKVENDSLRIRSPRTASRYLNVLHGPLKDADGFVDTMDILDLRNERYYFVGRRDGVINVGGVKVHPEEVEEVINRHPKVRMSLVRTKKSSMIGSVVVADVVLRSAPGPESGGDRHILQDILLLCREELASHKVPSTINFVSKLAVADSGKLMRPRHG
jgi:acyl-coenzyme A synthetase/AMP-(fatty) acid ligase